MLVTRYEVFDLDVLFSAEHSLPAREWLASCGHQNYVVCDRTKADLNPEFFFVLSFQAFAAFQTSIALSTSDFQTAFDHCLLLNKEHYLSTFTFRPRKAKP